MGQTLLGLPQGSQIGSPQGVLAEDGLVVLHAQYFQPGGSSSEQQVFWRDDGLQATLVVRDGMQAPGLPPGYVFGQSFAFVGGSFDHWDASPAGHLAFRGFVKGPGIDLDDDEGIWAEGPAGLQLVARERAAGPAGSGAGVTFRLHQPRLARVASPG